MYLKSKQIFKNRKFRLLDQMNGKLKKNNIGIKTILKVENLPKLDDTTDSMAAAICHAHSAKFAEKL